MSVRSPLVLGPNAFAWFHVTFTAEGPVIVAEEAEAGWKLLARFVDQAVAAYGADPGLVFLAGFSQGGISLAPTPGVPIAGLPLRSARPIHRCPVPFVAGKEEP